MTRVAFLGPAGTFSEEALLANAPPGLASMPTTTILDAILAVRDGDADRALVPIENALEGAVNVTLDALVGEADGVRIVGEVVHPVAHALIAREALGLHDIAAVISHPQATAQCAAFIRNRLPEARVLAASSTADAVRTVAASDKPWAAIGTQLAAQLHDCVVLLQDVEDVSGNETRFVWLAPAGTPSPPASGAPAKTSVVFWGAGDQAPGWLARCLMEFADRGVDLTRIESRPRRIGLGRYRFFLDLEGHTDDRAVAEALDALAKHCEGVRSFGSYLTAVSGQDAG